MKILDLHCHTLKTKQGDSKKRNVEIEKFPFYTKDVDFIAITNHNKFDIDNFNSLQEEVIKKGNKTTLWPGVEFDVNLNGEVKHFILVASNKNLDKFNKFVEEVLGNLSPDEFSIECEVLINKIKEWFDKDEIIIFPHFSIIKRERKIGPSEFEKLKEKLGEYIILAEPKDLAGISVIMEKTHHAMIGTDIMDWSNYIDEVQKIPKLEIDVDDFESFVLLCRHDNKIIETHINKIRDRRTNLITLGDGEKTDKITIPLTKGVNVIFGAKGTGKTEILKKLEAYFKSDEACKTASHITDDNNETFKEIITQNEKYNENIVLDLEKEIKYIKEWKNESKVNIEDFFEHENNSRNSAIDEKWKLRTLSDLQIPEFDIDEVKVNLEKIDNFSEIRSFGSFEKISQQDKTSFLRIINKILEFEKQEIFSIASDNFTSRIFNLSKKSISATLEKTTYSSTKPTTVNFSSFVHNKHKLKSEIKLIYDNLNTDNTRHEVNIGELPGKGTLWCIYENGTFGKGANSGETNGWKTELKNAKTIYKQIAKFLNDDKKTNIEDIQKKFNDSKITSLKQLSAKRFFTTLDRINTYEPSKGEKSIILLKKFLEFASDKEYVFIDEVESGFENNYVRNVIVEEIKALSNNTKVILTTHNANIAILTNPSNHIYRAYDKKGIFKTFVGNMYSNSLINLNDESEKINWMKVTTDTLEGSQQAFEDRGEIYEIRKNWYN